MIHIMLMSVVTAFAVGFVPANGVLAAKQEQQKPTVESFLMKAAEGQQAEILLGKLAGERAGDDQVKQFATKMIEDHQKAKQEVQQIAMKDNVQLPSQLNERHKQKQEQLSQLSGKDFDRAYIQYMLRDHSKEVKEFEQSAQTLQDQDVKQWASGALPVLKEHLQHAKTIASALGIPSPQAAQ